MTVEDLCRKFSLSRSSLQLLFKNSLNVPPKQYISNLKLTKSKELIKQNNYTISEIAVMCGFSTIHYFSRKFKEEFGMTFVQYLTNCRISHSKELLISTAVPTEQIAYRVGMNSYSYFCTCFKRLCGMSPGEYRRKNKAAKS